MTDWKNETNEPADTQADKTTEVPRDWEPSKDTINAISGKGDASAPREWVDQGIKDVPLSQIDLKDSHVHGADDFKKVSRDQMVDGFDKLENTVRPAVEKGAGSDYFQDLDQAQGLDYEHGHQRVYDSFYGDSAIRVEKTGDTYSVVNGYHRLAVANDLGLSTVPARVIALGS